MRCDVMLLQGGVRTDSSGEGLLQMITSPALLCRRRRLRASSGLRTATSCTTALVALILLGTPSGERYHSLV